MIALLLYKVDPPVSLKGGALLVSIDEDNIRSILRLKGKYLYRREGQELEYKEQFNLAGLADYFKDFAGFSNNRGGYIIFGIKDSPRVPLGLSESSMEQFEKIDPERITGFLLDTFSSDIRWEQQLIDLYKKTFGVFRIYEAATKPVIVKKNVGKNHLLKNGDIYYRYGGRTQKIQFAELENIISSRVEKNNVQWLDLMAKIGKAGPQNAAILDTERALIEKEDTQILVVDETLASKLSFVREGRLSKIEGSPTLKLVGDVMPIEQVEVIKKVRENLLKEYPLSAMELAEKIKGAVPGVTQNDVWRAIKENDIKSNPDYSMYNFRNKRQEDTYRESGVIPSSTPSIYNQKAFDFLTNVLKLSK